MSRAPSKGSRCRRWPLEDGATYATSREKNRSSLRDAGQASGAGTTRKPVFTYATATPDGTVYRVAAYTCRRSSLVSGTFRANRGSRCRDIVIPRGSRGDSRANMSSGPNGKIRVN